MQLDWQTCTALAVVAAAAGYLIDRSWRTIGRPRPTGCGQACSGCERSSEAPSPTPPLVSLRSPERP
ncbi:MAG: FeoB-associated Cys-rich membrane protein [Pirellulales bacterium]|nr:FeoB-associated Cys-rich membrane protein [Pirellulales bacterium]